MHKIFEYIEERIGFNLTFYFGMPIILGLCGLAILAVGWCVMQVLDIVEATFGTFAKSIALFWIIWTGCCLFLWLLVKEDEHDR